MECIKYGLGAEKVNLFVCLFDRWFVRLASV
jgi:hypothetical protein